MELVDESLYTYSLFEEQYNIVGIKENGQRMLN